MVHDSCLCLECCSQSSRNSALLSLPSLSSLPSLLSSHPLPFHVSSSFRPSLPPSGLLPNSPLLLSLPFCSSYLLYFVYLFLLLISLPSFRSAPLLSSLSCFNISFFSIFSAVSNFRTLTIVHLLHYSVGWSGCQSSFVIRHSSLLLCYFTCSSEQRVDYSLFHALAAQSCCLGSGICSRLMK